MPRGAPLFLHAARACGAEPARCAVIADSRSGVDAANAAGMTGFGFARVTPAGLLAMPPAACSRPCASWRTC
jgi:beta-phosphoglucomutase-like phosphatase (HAD superfamily)